MAITPNYSWPLPDNTSLVKDGAEAIRDLGNAIDTTVDGLPSGGLVHIKTSAFTGATSHSFGDDTDPIFSSDYENYKIMLTNLVGASISPVRLRLRANTTDLTSNVYDNQQLQVTGGSRFSAETVNQSFMLLGSMDTTAVSSVIFELTDPFLARVKTTQSSGMFLQTGPFTRIELNYGNIDSAVSYNAFTILSTANFSGTMSVYGYKI